MINKYCTFDCKAKFKFPSCSEEVDSFENIALSFGAQQVTEYRNSFMEFFNKFNGVAQVGKYFLRRYTIKKCFVMFISILNVLLALLFPNRLILWHLLLQYRFPQLSWVVRSLSLRLDLQILLIY